MDLLLYPATLVLRYKRFLADVILADGEAITVHCPNTGSMKNCIQPMSPCWYSTSASAARKYPHTLEIVTTPDGDLAGINTARSNGLVAAAICSGVIAELQGYSDIRREVVYGNEKSRIDFLLTHENKKCYVEVKNVTLMEAKGHGLFPDAVSERGTKHLRELMQMVREGHRAVLLYCVQHTGIEWVEPADAIDPLYGKTLREAIAAGVEVIAYRAEIEPEKNKIVLAKKLAVKI
ncbi:sugar fermentation stimulation protein [Cellvibrio zantedeschiae]|uniref:Sugar fermentation stimulation protein homolog n=1 Tax=Cellvibrio zantedeschiae TaxID=1237077 RepID=A0ABQ3B5G3_9GAMM|nr:DNA/RNA nuclease SfsA [Cellvibrio zantedeschiae]GGY80095.1 sugar fermentation stimulation protein [Cellvibrio zantedeschiae]